MLHLGRLGLCGPLEEIKRRHRRMTLQFELPQTKPPAIPGALNVLGGGREWTVICNAGASESLPLALQAGARLTHDDAASLEEVFVAHSTAS